MNILFLLRLWPVYGGGETVTIRLANEMVRNGWNVTVAYFKDSTKKDTLEIDQRVSTFKIDHINCDEFIADIKSSIEVQNKIIEYINKNNINIVINQWWPVYYIDCLKKETSAKIFTCLHQAFYAPIIEEAGLKGTIKRILLPFYKMYKKRNAVKQVTSFLPYVDKYIFLSPSFQHQFERFSNYNGNKLASISNPLVYNSCITEAEFNQKENIVLLVGRMLEGQKRVSLAIKIWRLIENNELLNGWTFVIVGEGPDLVKYKQYAKKLGLKRIVFEGYQIPLKYYKRAKIFVMTSAFEGFGMTLVEAQQCGVVPIVMDSYLSLHDIIIDGFNGVISKNGDLTDFSNKLTNLMTNNMYRDKLSINAIKSSAKFSIKNIFKEWKRLCYDKKVWVDN